MMSRLCGIPMNGGQNEIKDYMISRVVVLVGHRFGLRRHGSESVLFQQELWRYILNVVAVGRIPGVMLLNFSPQSCATIRKVRMGVPDYPNCTLEGMLITDQGPCPETMRGAELEHVTFHRCFVCEVANPAEGPSFLEIEDCKRRNMVLWGQDLWAQDLWDQDMVNHLTATTP